MFQDKEENAILERLCPFNVNPKADQQQYSEITVPGTAEWIFRTPIFKSWVTDGSFLWIHGGSTVLVL